jgi:hypothetical protein
MFVFPSNQPVRVTSLFATNTLSKTSMSTDLGSLQKPNKGHTSTTRSSREQSRTSSSIPVEPSTWMDRRESGRLQPNKPLKVIDTAGTIAMRRLSNSNHDLPHLNTSSVVSHSLMVSRAILTPMVIRSSSSRTEPNGSN